MGKIASFAGTDLLRYLGLDGSNEAQELPAAWVGLATAPGAKGALSRAAKTAFLVDAQSNAMAAMPPALGYGKAARMQRTLNHALPGIETPLTRRPGQSATSFSEKSAEHGSDDKADKAVCADKTKSECSGDCNWQNNECVKKPATEICNSKSGSECTNDSNCYRKCQPKSDSSSTNCGKHTTEGACTNDSSCDWKCNARPAAVCGEKGKTSCEAASADCQWVADTSKCKPKADKQCPTYTTQSTCTGDSACSWSNDTCGAASP